jgi:hypothetical protein
MVEEDRKEHVQMVPGIVVDGGERRRGMPWIVDGGCSGEEVVKQAHTEMLSRCRTGAN